jgi:hypothetical protein
MCRHALSVKDVPPAERKGGRLPSVEERRAAIASLLDDDMRRFTRPGGDIGLLLSAAVGNIRKFCEEKAWEGDGLHGQLWFMAYDADHAIRFVHPVLRQYSYVT